VRGESSASAPRSVAAARRASYHRRAGARGLHSGPGIFTVAGEPDDLPSSPRRFVLHFVGYYRWAIGAMAVFELGQAACQILIPKAIQGLIDAVLGFDAGAGSVWAGLSRPMTFFVLLNLGILVFSRSSGA